MIHDVQLNQGHYTWPELRAVARAAETAGYNTLWIVDHLAGEVMAAKSMPECFTLLGALAEATSTIRLGVLVANVGTRHPGVLANAAATVQNLSGDRFTLGLGAGPSPKSSFASELHALDMAIPASMTERHRRVEETLDLLEAMWSPTRDERYATFPMPSSKIPVVIGVNSITLAQVASRRADGVNVRASHERRAEILAAAQPSDERPFISSVWDYFDPQFLSRREHVDDQLAGEGVNRVVWFVRGKADPRTVAS